MTTLLSSFFVQIGLAWQTTGLLLAATLQRQYRQWLYFVGDCKLADEVNARLILNARMFLAQFNTHQSLGSWHTGYFLKDTHIASYTTCKYVAEVPLPCPPLHWAVSSVTQNSQDRALSSMLSMPSDTMQIEAENRTKPLESLAQSVAIPIQFAHYLQFPWRHKICSVHLHSG